MPLVEDLVRRATLNQVAQATTATRTFRVSGIVAAPYDIMPEALKFAGVPRIGDDYPGVNEWNMVARQADVLPDGKPDSCLVVVTYSNKRGDSYNQPPPTDDGLDVKQTSTRLAEYETTVDVQDNPMTISAPPSEESKPSYLSKARATRIVGSVVFERVEKTPPLLRTRQAVGTLNSDPLPTVSPIYGAKVMKFVDFQSRTTDGGRTYRVRYEFAYDVRGWFHRDRYTRGDGKVPVDAPELSWDLDLVYDFNLLGLDFSDSQTELP